MLMNIDRHEIADFCKKHGILRLSLFGSSLREDFGAKSDIDVLVEFEDGRAPGLDFFLLDEALSRILSGRKIDLVTPKSIRGDDRRKEILESARVIYEAA